MYKTVRNLYRMGKLNAGAVAAAVKKGFITKAQYTEITGLVYAEV